MASGCESLMRESSAVLGWVFSGEGDGGSCSPVPLLGGGTLIPWGPVPGQPLALGRPSQVAQLLHITVFGQSSVWTHGQLLFRGLCTLGGGLQALLGALALWALVCLSFSQVQHDPSIPNHLLASIEEIEMQGAL